MKTKNAVEETESSRAATASVVRKETGETGEVETDAAAGVNSWRLSMNISPSFELNVLFIWGVYESRVYIHFRSSKEALPADVPFSPQKYADVAPNSMYTQLVPVKVSSDPATGAFSTHRAYRAQHEHRPPLLVACHGPQLVLRLGLDGPPSPQ